ncbi:MAG: LPP20 family lipoprotein [Idiomarinaceae bacterium HL-53]|nr:MAG: LPP20 family lipoprotein [Idiomarinaceae bacterium HL-53]
MRLAKTRQLMIGVRGSFPLTPIIFLALFITGCAAKPEQRPTARDELTTIGLQSDRFAYGHGFGETRERALQAARDELAEMILVNVRTETRQDLRATSDQEVTSEFVASSFSWSNVELENLQVDYEQRNRNDNTWYVRLRLDRPTVARLTQQARQKAPALNAVYQIEQIERTQPAARLRNALQGYNIARRDDVLKESFITANGSQANLESFFKEVADASVRALKALPILHENGNRIAFALIHEATGTPQRSATVYLRMNSAEQALLTDSNGLTAFVPLNDINQNFSLVMRTGDITVEGSRIERFQEVDRYTKTAVTNASEAMVYFYLDPIDANVRINNESLGSPNRHPLPSGQNYQLSIRSERYRAREETLRIPNGAAFAFVNAELEARQYGSLALSVNDREGMIELRRDSDDWQTSNGNTFHQELAEAGSYAIRVGRRGLNGFDPDYQITQDLVELQNEQVYEQQYEAPRYREPYSHGWRVGISTARLGGEPSASYRIPYVKNGQETREGHYGEFKTDADLGAYWGSGDDFVLSVQRYFDTLNFTVQGSIGNHKHTFDIDSDIDVQGWNTFQENREVQLDAFTASIGAGFWKSFYDDMVLASLTVNQAFESAKWNLGDPIDFEPASNSRRARLPSDKRTSNSYAFAELNAHLSFGGGLGITLGVIVPAEQMEPYFHFGFSYSFFESGYKYPAIVSR